MTPEENFNEQVWEVLQDIKEEFLATTDGSPVKYRIPNIVGAGIIPPERHKKILYKLEEKKAFKIHRNSEGTRIGTGDLFYLIIDPLKFDETYRSYQKSSEDNNDTDIKPDSMLDISNYRDIPANIAVTDLQSKYQEIEQENNHAQFFIKIAHYGQYILENAATIFVLESLYDEARNDAKPYLKAWEEFFKEWQYYTKDILEKAEKAGIEDDRNNPLSNEVNRLKASLNNNETSLYESGIGNYYINYWYLVRKFSDLNKSDLLIPKHFDSLENPMKLSGIYDNANNEWNKFKQSREAKVWWAHYQICRLAAGVLDLKQKESYFKDDNAIDGFYRFEFSELARGNRISTPIVLHADKYRIWIKRLHDYLIPRLQNVDMDWVIGSFRAKQQIKPVSKTPDDIKSWSDKFKWINENNFYLDEGKTISFGAKSSDRKSVFQMLTDAKGSWVKVSDMAEKIGKSQGRTRTVLAQVNKDKLEKFGIILIVPKSDTNEAGAYRIKLLSQN